MKKLILCILVGICVGGCMYTSEFGPKGQENDKPIVKTEVDEIVESEGKLSDLPEDHGFKKKGLRWSPPPDPDKGFRDILPYTGTASDY